MKTEKAKKSRAPAPAPASKPLTPDQRKAATAIGQNVLVSAGAGSGKTRVLVDRFLALVLSGQAAVTEILTLTFTDKAANEMKGRILDGMRDLGMDHARKDLEGAWVSTFHAFASRVLREHPLEAGLDPEFRVMEEEEAAFLREEAMDAAVEAAGQKGSETYELLRVYGEDRIREGVIKVLHAARHEGRLLADYFKRPGPAAPAASPADLFEKLDEKDLAAEWRRFEKAAWDWEMLEAFREWRTSWSRKRDKKGASDWKDLKRLAERWAAFKLEPLAQPWRERFEILALSFETLYEGLKKDRGLLDFDDLGMRALALFQGESRARKKLLETYRQKFRFIFVDEFQDTNRLQMTLVEHLSSGDNLFLVGDYKQSIYGFRGAEPRLFLEKEAVYREGRGGGCLGLKENFRTAPSVLGYINRFFENLWEEDGLRFEPLISMTAEDPEAGAELFVLKPAQGETADLLRMREAEALAARILKLREDGIPFGEMALLFQAMTKTGIYEQALKRSGIPYVVFSGGGFYHQPEIRDMLSVLAHLENPLSSIPLAGALRSPLFQVRDETLFWLTRDAGGAARVPLYQGLKNFSSNPHLPEEEKKKLAAFLALTGSWFEQKDRLRITELLDRILAGTSYDLTVLADPQGARRYANLKKLVAVAREFETREPLSVSAFLRLVKRLEMRDVRESEAQLEAGAGGRAVRLMTIHKAKGLEFPVVILPNLERSGRSAAAKTVLADPQTGYGMMVRNEKTMDFEKPLSWLDVDQCQERRESEEWKRLFYVAMTRSKKKLILSGAWDDEKKPKERENYHAMTSWMEWLMSSPQEGLSFPAAAQDRRTRKGESLAEVRRLKDFFPDLKPLAPESFLPEQGQEEVLSRAEKLMDAVSPLTPSPSRVVHLPVSAYAAFSKDPAEYRRIYETGLTRPETDYEGVMLEAAEEISAADFGTAMHHVLERMDFRNPDAVFMKECLDRAFGGMAPTYRKEAGEILERFTESGLCLKLRQANRVFRELPFILGERHGMIHGVIDLLYQDEAGDWHVVDYKTAVGDKAKVEASGYRTQIELYGLAVQRLLGKTPRTGVLFFLKNSWEYRVEWKSGELEKAGARIRVLQESLLETGQFSSDRPGQL